MTLYRHCVKSVKVIELLGRGTFPGEVKREPSEAGYSLNITAVYQDDLGREWGMEVLREATRLAGQERVQHAWFEIGTLASTVIRRKAAGAAAIADVIVMSVRGADDVSPEFRAWVDGWMSRRKSRAGALVALLAVDEVKEARSLPMMNYLEQVAQQAGLDFIPQQRERPVPRIVLANPIIAPTAFPLPNDRSLYTFRHYGLNE